MTEEVNLNRYLDGLKKYCQDKGLDGHSSRHVTSIVWNILDSSNGELDETISKDTLANIIFTDTKKYERPSIHIKESTMLLTRLIRDFTIGIVGRKRFEKEYEGMVYDGEGSYYNTS